MFELHFKTEKELAKGRREVEGTACGRLGGVVHLAVVKELE